MKKWQFDSLMSAVSVIASNTSHNTFTIWAWAFASMFWGIGGIIGFIKDFKE